MSSEEHPARRAPTRHDVTEAESYLYRNGLPYFSDPTREWVRHRLRPEHLLSAAVTLVLITGGVTWALGEIFDPLGAILVAPYALAVLVMLYALFVLRGVRIIRWGLRRTRDGLRLLFPLATRALPILLLFMTFLFINTEVWMVADKLHGSVLLASVMLFLIVATVFLVARMPQEVQHLELGLDRAVVAQACAGTPLEDWTDLDAAPGVDEPIVGLERANLVLVMLISQLIQVLLLAVSVFVFFVVFGAVVMDPSVVQAWITHPPTPILGQVRISTELVRVSVFLSAFAGLYFTVTAVTDEHYRREFFGSIVGELERAIGLREVYRAMKRATGRAAAQGD